VSKRGATSSLESFRRPLTPTEMRLLRAKIRSLSARCRRASTIHLPIAAAFIVALWLLTLVASNAPWLIVTMFWIVIGGIITLWVGRDLRRDAGAFEDMARSLDSALRRNAADVYDVRARRFAELEEIEDEGACYVFELEGGRLVFISGQEFYPGARFPSLDFSLVYVLDEHGHAPDMLIEKRGPRAAPAKLIPAAVKRKLELPDHLEIRAGRIDDLEDQLSVRSAVLP
jgi:hypothetical protein